MELEKQISGSSIDGLVIFTGNVENPEDFYQAMDVFALPSLFEAFLSPLWRHRLTALQLWLPPGS